jgi:cytochrome c oxidase assembly factor CtaG
MVQHLILAQLVPLLLTVLWRVRWRLPALLSWIMGIAMVIGTSIPPAYELARASATADWSIRGALLVTGVVFWIPVVGRVPGTRLNPGAALVYSITACFATTLAGIYIAFSATTTDQQVAGLIMWVPCCIIYLTAALAVVLRTMRGANAMVGHEAH